MPFTRAAKLCLALTLVSALGPAQAAGNDQRDVRDDEPQDDSSLLERILITPPSDEFSDRDRRRRKIEKSLPGMGTEGPAPETTGDRFLDALLYSDVNKAGSGQRRIIEKLDDPDSNRLPR